MAAEATETVEEKSVNRFGVDAASRAWRRIRRSRSNAERDRRAVTGVLATLFGGIFWGFSGTCASFLFENYTVDTTWLMCARQIVSGLIFLIVILSRRTDRGNLVRLLTTKRDVAVLVVFSALGVLLNQYGYLMAVRLTNAGTATVLQCLQLVMIMVYSCWRSRRAPRRREFAGVVLALAGTYLLATGGNPSNLAIPLEGLTIGLVAAVGAACMSIIPARILPKYGASVVTGSGMLLSGIVLGGFIGEMAAGISGLSWLNFGQSFGLNDPMVLNFGILVLTFGLSIRITMASIIGVIIAILVYRFL